MPDVSDMHAAWRLNLTDTGALAAIVWEICIRIDDEIEFIWPKPNRSFVKWLYFFTRYMVLLAAIGSRILSISILNNTGTLLQCRSLWAGQSVVSQMAITSTEIILMLRVYALYNRTRRIGLILLSVLMVENLIHIYSTVICVPTLPFHEFCLVKRIPTPALYSGSSTVITQVVILGLTLVKHSFARREGWGRTPVISLVLRDGSYVFLIISAVGIIRILYFFLGPSFGAHLYWWFIYILSSFGSGLIINMQRLAMPPQPESSASPEFTTNIYHQTAPMTDNSSDNMSVKSLDVVSDATANWDGPPLVNELPSTMRHIRRF